MAIERFKKFKIGEKEFTATFPNVGQIIDLESFKQALTSNRYGQMAASGISSMYNALDLVDAIAFFQIVVPEVGKYFGIKNYTVLQLDKISALIKAYQEQIRPWYDKTMNELKGINGNDGATQTKNNN